MQLRIITIGERRSPLYAVFIDNTSQVNHRESKCLNFWNTYDIYRRGRDRSRGRKIRCWMMPNWGVLRSPKIYIPPFLRRTFGTCTLFQYHWSHRSIQFRLPSTLMTMMRIYKIQWFSFENNVVSEDSWLARQRCTSSWTRLQAHFQFKLASVPIYIYIYIYIYIASIN